MPRSYVTPREKRPLDETEGGVTEARGPDTKKISGESEDMKVDASTSDTMHPTEHQTSPRDAAEEDLPSTGGISSMGPLGNTSPHYTTATSISGLSIESRPGIFPLPVGKNSSPAPAIPAAPNRLMPYPALPPAARPPMSASLQTISIQLPSRLGDLCRRGNFVAVNEPLQFDIHVRSDQPKAKMPISVILVRCFDTI